MRSRNATSATICTANKLKGRGITKYEYNDVYAMKCSPGKASLKLEEVSKCVPW